MVLSKQQKYLKGVIESLGCAREDQLVALLRAELCSGDPNAAEDVTEAALRRLRCCWQQLRAENGVYHMTNVRPDDRALEAVDVMIELSKAKPLCVHREKAPKLLRFSIQEQKVRRFLIAEYGASPEELQPEAHERIVLLFDAQGQAQPLSVSNKQFFAVRQEDGSHRFFAADGQ